MEDWACFVRSLSDKYGFQEQQQQQQQRQDLQDPEFGSTMVRLSWITPSSKRVPFLEESIDFVEEEFEESADIPTEGPDSRLECSTGGAYNCMESAAEGTTSNDARESTLGSGNLVSWEACQGLQVHKPGSPTSVLLIENECSSNGLVHITRDGSEEPTSTECSSPHQPNTALQSLDSHQGTKWVGINKLLSGCGFAPIEPPVSEDQLHDTLVDLVRDYGRRETLVQDLLQELDECRKTEEHNNLQITKLDAEIQLCKRKLATTEQRSEVALSTAEKANASLRKDLQCLEATNTKLLQRCSQLEHNCRAKERAAQRYQNKLVEVIEKEENRRSREMESYRNLKNKVVKARRAQGDSLDWNLFSPDLRPIQLVSIFERQKAATASELCALRSAVASLCQELRDKENFILGNFTDIKSRNSHFHRNLLEQLCKKLQLNSPIELHAAVDGLLRVNAAVPFLEEFVEDVCNVVLISGKQFLPRTNMDNPREVPDVLKTWLETFSACKLGNQRLQTFA